MLRHTFIFLLMMVLLAIAIPTNISYAETGTYLYIEELNTRDATNNIHEFSKANFVILDSEWPIITWSENSLSDGQQIALVNSLKRFNFDIKNMLFVSGFNTEYTVTSDSSTLSFTECGKTGVSITSSDSNKVFSFVYGVFQLTGVQTPPPPFALASAFVTEPEKSDSELVVFDPRPTETVIAETIAPITGKLEKTTAKPDAPKTTTTSVTKTSEPTYVATTTPTTAPTYSTAIAKVTPPSVCPPQYTPAPTPFSSPTPTPERLVVYTEVPTTKAPTATPILAPTESPTTSTPIDTLPPMENSTNATVVDRFIKPNELVILVFAILFFIIVILSKNKKK